eukprot:6794819-Prymnesium_polylepis.2
MQVIIVMRKSIMTNITPSTDASAANVGFSVRFCGPDGRRGKTLELLFIAIDAVKRLSGMGFSAAARRARSGERVRGDRSSSGGVEAGLGSLYLKS